MFLNFVELCIKCTKDMITIIFVEQDFHQFLFNCNVFWGCFFVVLLIVLFFVIYTHCMINFSSLHHYQNLKIDIAILRRENIIYNLVNQLLVLYMKSCVLSSTMNTCFHSVIFSSTTAIEQNRRITKTVIVFFVAISFSLFRKEHTYVDQMSFHVCTLVIKACTFKLDFSFELAVSKS